MESPKVEASLKDSRVQNLLTDLMELCLKHNIFIFTDSGETIIEFSDWDFFTKPNVDPGGASLYWPRIQTDIVVQGRYQGMKKTHQKNYGKPER